MPGNGKVRGDSKVVAIAAEVVCQHDLRRRRRELAISDAQGVPLGLREI